MALTFDRDSLAARFDRLTPPGAVVFLASCAERRAPALVLLDDVGRSQDGIAAARLLDALWATALDASVVVEWDTMDTFEEIAAAEEHEGLLAFTEDAVVCLWYAARYVRNNEESMLLNAAIRSYDSAGYVDDLVADSDFGEVELRMQSGDLGLATNAASFDEPTLARIRDRSAAEGIRAFRAASSALA